MAFFCIYGMLTCLQPHSTNAWAYSAYYAVPIQSTQPVTAPRIDRTQTRVYSPPA